MESCCLVITMVVLWPIIFLWCASLTSAVSKKFLNLICLRQLCWREHAWRWESRVRVLQGRSHRPDLPLLCAWPEGDQVLGAPDHTGVIVFLICLVLFVLCWETLCWETVVGFYRQKILLLSGCDLLLRVSVTLWSVAPCFWMWRVDVMCRAVSYLSNCNRIRAHSGYASQYVRPYQHVVFACIAIQWWMVCCYALQTCWSSYKSHIIINHASSVALVLHGYVVTGRWSGG